MTDINPETPPVAAAEARSVAPARISSMHAVVQSRLLTVGVDTLLGEVAALLSGAQISVVVVCDGEGTMVGVITETMLVQQLGLGHVDVFTTRASKAMACEYTVCSPADSLSTVLAMMHNLGLIHVPVVDANHRPLGVVNARDGLRALLAAGNHEEALLRNYVMGLGYQ